MFWAINKNTEEKVNSLQLTNNTSYIFIEDEIWYADPDEIEYCPKEIDIKTIPVKFKKGKDNIINFNGTKFNVSPHFFIPNKSKLGINVVPESREHKLAKNWVYNTLLNNEKDLKVKYSSISKPYKYSNSYNLSELPLDKQKIGIEITCNTSIGQRTRRADIICPFLIRHHLLGDGIVFEIQFSNQRPSTKFSRELDWAIRGYSVCWLYKEDFEFATDIVCLLKEHSVNVSSFASLIKHSNKQFMKNLRLEVQELSRKLELKKKDVFEEINRKFKDSLHENLETNLDEIINEKLKFAIQDYDPRPKCSHCKMPAVLKKNYSNGDKFWGCANYPICRWTSAYIE